MTISENNSVQTGGHGMCFSQGEEYKTIHLERKEIEILFLNIFIIAFKNS